MYFGVTIICLLVHYFKGASSCVWVCVIVCERLWLYDCVILCKIMWGNICFVYFVPSYKSIFEFAIEDFQVILHVFQCGAIKYFRIFWYMHSKIFKMANRTSKFLREQKSTYKFSIASVSSLHWGTFKFALEDFFCFR